MLRRDRTIKVVLYCFILLITFEYLVSSVEAKVKTIVLSNEYPIRKDELSLSGFSAGASYAHLFHMIHSKLFVGVGIFGGLFYKYPEGLEHAKETIKSNQEKGLIDQSKYTENDKVFAWAGTNDSHHGIGVRLDGLVEIYEPILKSPLQLFTKVEFAPHKMPTGYCSKSMNSNSPKKPESDKDYMGNCYYDGHFHMFQFFYGQKFSSDKCSTNPKCKFSKNLYKFDQSKYFPKKESSGMSKNGLIYIPEKCKNKKIGKDKCYLHIFFHGCGEDGEKIKNAVKHVLNRKNLNILSLAKKNNVIVLFPLADGCFVDYFGKREENYDNKNGIRVQIVRKMIKKLTGL